MTITIVDKGHVIVTRGWWIWKRQAYVHKDYIDWYFKSGKQVGAGLFLRIHAAFNPLPAKPPKIKDWEKIPKSPKLPLARLLGGK